MIKRKIKKLTMRQVKIIKNNKIIRKELANKSKIFGLRILESTKKERISTQTQQNGKGGKYILELLREISISL